MSRQMGGIAKSAPLRRRVSLACACYSLALCREGLVSLPANNKLLQCEEKSSGKAGGEAIRRVFS